ncbi:hypothetical protein PFICI_12731 [Pestalotiopsis fici W106-1]|uniref:Uncharacterized protein n=1 Tax=Pestalotiopsis fici (strain W106-1 / CGMCC3.15140) TaxID=1229662 RepID=W3WRN1_PESFW|nr:uncharacterized protein PFICI_12731 [Pestalotiopsis fici W106-1]ETS75787.1 hypothetical protein PFICI_12731 [Pestalotiopsis fici W106-1]
MSANIIRDSIDQHVHTGLWTDWSNGPVLGRTLTMSRSNGNLLIAFTASFVAFVATCFWRILCLAIHRCCSSQDPRNALHGQRQVILRNSSSAESGLISLVRLSWAWRHLGPRRLLHLLFLSCLAATIAAAFTVAGGFSSVISSAVEDVVLIDSSNCGFIGAPTNASLIGPSLMFISEQLNSAANYAQQCYSSNSSGVLGCSRFVRDKIPKLTMTNTSCPFENGLCRSNDSNIMLDTGPINTNDVLGLNAPEGERSSYRSVLSCAPIVTDGYATQRNTSNGNFVQYNYGQLRMGSLENQTMVNYTLETNDLESQYSRSRDPNSWSGFNHRLRCQSSATINGQPSFNNNHHGWIPLPGLQRPDGDVTLAFLSGDGIVYNQPTEDIWYRASVPGVSKATKGAYGQAQSYMPDEAASPLGCVEQYQICNLALPNNSGCGPLASFYDAMAGAAPFFNFTSQEWLHYWETGTIPPENRAAARLTWIFMMWTFEPVTLNNIITKMGASSLISQSQLYGGTQYGLPSNQWQSDVAHCDAALDDFRFLPDGSIQEEFCNSQKIRSSSYTSFSAFGLCFTYVTGGLIILISVIIEPILSLFYKKYGYQRYRQLEWTTNQQLQLHRLVHEPLGHGTWSRGTEFVPITEKDEFLGELDVSTDHPVIAKPSSKTEYQAGSGDNTLSGDPALNGEEDAQSDEQTIIDGRTGRQTPDGEVAPREDGLPRDTTTRIDERVSAPQSADRLSYHDDYSRADAPGTISTSSFSQV